MVLAAQGCFGPQDDPSQVHDLRVLGVTLDPPELMGPVCPDFNDPTTIPAADIATFIQPVALRALIVDPKGNGRPISYEVFACAQLGDRACERDSETVLIASGQTTAGEFQLTINPGTVVLPSGQPLLSKVLIEDVAYRGLGGIRMPLVLHVGAQGEEIFAQKIMVFSCQFFADQTANLNPTVPAFFLNEQPWPNAPPDPLSGRGPFRIHPEDLTAVQETYVVPGIDLTRVDLVERWKLSWYTDYGTFSPNTTGGTDLAGRESRHDVQWLPPAGAEERDVNYWVVIRDGRGGMAWDTWSSHYTP